MKRVSNFITNSIFLFLSFTIVFGVGVNCSFVKVENNFFIHLFYQTIIIGLLGFVCAFTFIDFLKRNEKIDNPSQTFDVNVFDDISEEQRRYLNSFIYYTQHKYMDYSYMPIFGFYLVITIINIFQYSFPNSLILFLINLYYITFLSIIFLKVFDSILKNEIKNVIGKIAYQKYISDFIYYKFNDNRLSALIIFILFFIIVLIYLLMGNNLF